VDCHLEPGSRRVHEDQSAEPAECVKAALGSWHLAITLCHPDRSVRFAFPPLFLRRADAKWRDLLLDFRHAEGCRP
jgi:hypothetical protein